jgi:putative transposase
MMLVPTREMLAVIVWRERAAIEAIGQRLKQYGFDVSINGLCWWFEISRRTVYYKPTNAPVKLWERPVKPIKETVEQKPSSGYRSLANPLEFRMNIGQCNFSFNGRHAFERRVGMRPRVKELPSVADMPSERGTTGICRIWSVRDGWKTLALVLYNHSREWLGWHLFRRGRSKTAESALEQVLIARFGMLGPVQAPYQLRSDSGLVFTSRGFTALEKVYGLSQGCITSHNPQRISIVEPVIRTLNGQCVHRPRFERLQHASLVISGWMGFYNQCRPY